MIRFPRFIRRAWHRSRVARLAHEVALLQSERESFERRLYNGLRDLRRAREDLFFVDVHRPPITHAPGRPRAMTTGTVRRLTPMSDALAERDAREAKATPVLASRAPSGAVRARDFSRPKTPKIAGEAS